MRAELDFHAVFESSPNPYMLVDRELRYVAANRAYLHATSRGRDELIGRHMTDVFPHDPNDPNNESKLRLEASFERVLATGQADVLPLIHYRILVRRPDGEQWEDRYWSATHTPILAPDGTVERVLQHTVDVTELQSKRDEAGVLARAARVQEQTKTVHEVNVWMQSLFAKAPVALSVLSGSQHVVELANARVLEMWGRTSEQILGRPLFEAMPDICGQGLEELLAGVLATGEPHVGTQLPVQIARGPDGALETAWFDFVYQPLDGERIVVVANEVTEAVVARRKSEATQAELEAIFESFPEAIFVGDVSGVKRANAQAREILGYESSDQLLRGQQVLVRELAPLVHETGLPLEAKDTPYARALRGEASQATVSIAHWKTKDRRVLYCSGAPVRVGGETVGAIVTQIDITDQKNAEAEARKLARVLDETRDFVGIADATGNPTFLNQAALELVGLPDLASACNRHMLEYFTPRDRERVKNEIVPSAIRDGYWEGESAFVHFQTGEEIPILYSVFPLRDGRGETTALATITRDLRVQKTAEAERARLLENEQLARAQAEKANTLKDEFLAIVSHELRTPLTSILGWMQMLRTGLVPADKRARAMETVERNARVQAQLVDDLLDVSRIISGKLQLEVAATDIGAVVASAADTVRPTAEAKGVKLDVAIEPGHMVMGDGHRLQQVVWNLVSNAVKFTPKGGRVVLMVDRRNGDVEITVQDTGKGIARDFLPHVFERFRQASGGTDRALGGLGLGLSIVHHVVVAHGGTVTAESDGVGHGSVFRVRLPLTDRSTATMRDAVDVRTLPNLDGVHVLVVDDDDDARDLLRALLGRANAKVSTAANAEEGLAALVRERPDILVSDIAMPLADGYSLVRRLRALADADLSRIPAIALSAHARSEDRTQALLAGFQNHVSKPVDPGELLAVLASQTKRA